MIEQLTFPDGLSIPLRYRTSQKAKSGRLIVTREGIEIVLTRRMGQKAMLAFLEERKLWALNQYLRLKARKPETTTALPLTDGSTLPLFGIPHRLVFESTSHRRLTITHTHDQCLRIAFPTSLPPSEHGWQLKQSLKRWLQAHFKQQAEEWIDHYSPALNTGPSALHLRQQRSRWGSCTHDGVINLNWLLVFAPREVAEYVTLHEMAHLVHMDHSPDFWNVVARLMPTYNRHRQWLKTHGSDLHRLININ